MFAEFFMKRVNFQQLPSWMSSREALWGPWGPAWGYLTARAASPWLHLKSDSPEATLGGGFMWKWYIRKCSQANWSGSGEVESERKGGPERVPQQTSLSKHNVGSPRRQLWSKSWPRVALVRGQGAGVCIPLHSSVTGRGGWSGQSPRYFRISCVRQNRFLQPWCLSSDKQMQMLAIGRLQNGKGIQWAERWQYQPKEGWTCKIK